jgi:hypothetical protein
MRQAPPALDPEAYVRSLEGWRLRCVTVLREAVRKAGAFVEVIKWGHLVYRAHGPAILIRAEEQRVLLGFWRGQRLRTIEPRLKPGGRYEMATIEIRDGTVIKASTITRLAREAIRLNRTLGDPTGTS